MTRILYYYASQQLDTGSPRALLGLIKLLDRDRFEPLFLATGDGPLVDALVAEGVTIVRAPVQKASPRSPLLAAFRLIRQARRLLQWRVGIVHVNEFGWNLDLVLAAGLLRIPVILHAHLPVDIHPWNLNRFAARRLLFVSDSHRKAALGLGRLRAKCEVLPNPIDLEWYGSGRSVRAALGLTPDQIVVCTIAQLRYGKGIDIVLDAARRLLPRWKQLIFLVAGRLGHGEEEHGRRMMAEGGAEAFEGRVRFIGSRTDVPDILASCDLFLLPTRWETFGLAVIEAMAAGVPVVTSRLGVMEEIVTSTEVGQLVAPLTGEAFADAIESVLLLPDRGRAMGERGRASLAGRFDPQTVGPKLDAIYRGVLAKE